LGHHQAVVLCGPRRLQWRRCTCGQHSGAIDVESLGL
jgi:hypothetical protein